ncbi:unnamed protein product [Diamesa tonsa]
MDLAKLKVIELRAELTARGLDTKGTEYAKKMSTFEQKPASDSVSDVEQKVTPDTPSRRRRSSRSRTKSPSPVRTTVQEAPELSAVKEEEPEDEQMEEEETSTNAATVSEPAVPVDVPQQPVVITESELDVPQQLVKPENEFDEKILDEMEVDGEPAGDELLNEDELLAEPKTDVKEDTIQPAVEANIDETPKEEAEKPTTDDERRGKKRRSESPSTKPSSPKKRQRLPPPNIDDFVNDEDEPDLDNNLVQLSWFDSDLNLKINRETFCSANSLSDTGLALVWAGARANHGVKNNGKYFYEVQLVALNTKINYPNERRLHELRCGWSSSNSNLQLGENELSYGLDTSGKKCANNEFSDYSVKFGAIGDVIGVHLDVNDEMCNIQFNVNGKDQGIAFEFEKSSLNDEALFPHIVTKNIEFKVNFGQMENSLWSQAPDYQYIGKYEIETLASGPRRPESRKECEVIMLIGLPGAGKSFWALQRSKDNPTKRYTILGTKYLLEKMKIQGEPRKPNSGPGRWEKLIELCNRGLLTLNEIACQRRRNYILDQPHVYTSDQRRKMRVYGDFNRIAVIVVATEEEYKRRFQQRLEVEGKDIPEAAINEMRANLSLPELEYLWFNEIMYADLEKEPAHLEVSKENERGKKALSQRSRHNDYNRGRDGYGNRNQQDNRSRWSGAGNSGNTGNAGGGGNGGGRNDNYRRNDRWGPASGQRQMPLPPVGGGYRRDFDYNGRDRGRNWGGNSDWMNNRPRGGYGGAPPPRPGRKPEERRDDRGGRGGEYRDNRRNDNRNDNRRDYRSGSGSSSGNRKPDERRHDDRNRNKQSGKSDWNSAGSGSGSSGQWNYNNYSAGGSGGGGGNQAWSGNQWNQQQYGAGSADQTGDANQQQWMAYYQQQQQLGNSGQQWNQQAGQQQNWYNDQGYGGAFSSQSQAYDSQAKQ